MYIYDYVYNIKGMMIVLNSNFKEVLNYSNLIFNWILDNVYSYNFEFRYWFNIFYNFEGFGIGILYKVGCECVLLIYIVGCYVIVFL